MKYLMSLDVENMSFYIFVGAPTGPDPRRAPPGPRGGPDPRRAPLGPRAPQGPIPAGPPEGPGEGLPGLIADLQDTRKVRRDAM